MPERESVIYTIGHSTHSQEDFLGLLHHFSISRLADIRKYPGSKRFPHFNKENLENVLPCFAVLYQHWPGLGGRRKEIPESRHPEWKNSSFRAFADYMDSPEFMQDVNNLQEFSQDHNTVLMCTEAVWWRCHRALISDRLKELGWEVRHILPDKSLQAHPYTRAFREAKSSGIRRGFPER
jgi:uncharacterized protein (DUF488 family)